MRPHHDALIIGVLDVGHVLLMMWLVSSTIGNSNGKPFADYNVDVLHYGALGDGTTDDSEAFLNAWDAACNSERENPTIIVSEGKTFLVHETIFSGPCRAQNLTFLILGTIVAPESPQAWGKGNPSQWLVFHGVRGLNITGNGRIDGRGSGWWNQSCRYHPDLKTCTSLAPTAMKIMSSNSSSLTGMQFVNSPQAHISLLGCNGIEIKNVEIMAPDTSPNTDGIHIHASRNIIVNETRIGTGDDCVSIGDYTSNIDVSNIKCGPGHGISIGSLGRVGNSVQVERIHVSKVYFENTSNGARIKTWQNGRGYVRGVLFENLYFSSVRNPLIIDQNYCEKRGACKQQENGVHITDVTYGNLFGTSATEVAINLNCSRSVACTRIMLKSIRLRHARPGKNVSSRCTNAHGFTLGKVEPEPCSDFTR